MLTLGLYPEFHFGGFVSAQLRLSRMSRGFRHPTDARPADAEHLGDSRSAKTPRFHFSQIVCVYRTAAGPCRRPWIWPWLRGHAEPRATRNGHIPQLRRVSLNHD
jgi:hypothetical protein